jgi:hypothetical protein
MAGRIYILQRRQYGWHNSEWANHEEEEQGSILKGHRCLT